MNIIISYSIVFVVIFAIFGSILWFLDPILRRFLFTRRKNNYENGKIYSLDFPNLDFGGADVPVSSSDVSCGDGSIIDSNINCKIDVNCEIEISLE